MRQTKLASCLVNFLAHYKIVGLYFYFTASVTFAPTRTISEQKFPTAARDRGTPQMKFLVRALPSAHGRGKEKGPDLILKQIDAINRNQVHLTSI